MDVNAVERAARILRTADAILIGAGAGMSAAAGLDYNDEVAFAERFPAMLQYGARHQYQLMGYRYKDEALKWGYLAASLDLVYRAKPTAVYETLLSLVAGKDYFVMTSNVDRYFYKNGFDIDRIYTPQGDYELLQCHTPCHSGVWDAKPIINRILPYIDPDSQRVTAPSVLPICPNCGEAVYMNVRGGHWFIDAPYATQAEALNRWLDIARGARLAALEVGAGFITPGVIRAPMEAIGSRWPNASFIRINTENAEGPDGTISLKAPADEALSALAEKVEPIGS